MSGIWINPSLNPFLRTHPLALENPHPIPAFRAAKTQHQLASPRSPRKQAIQATRACPCLWRYRTSILSPTLNSPRQPPNFTPWLLTSRVWARWLSSLPAIQSRTGTTDMVLFDRRLPVRNRGMFYAHSVFITTAQCYAASLLTAVTNYEGMRDSALPGGDCANDRYNSGEKSKEMAVAHLKRLCASSGISAHLTRYASSRNITFNYRMSLLSNWSSCLTSVERRLAPRLRVCVCLDSLR
jgi:hypothetical protein